MQSRSSVDNGGAHPVLNVELVSPVFALGLAWLRSSGASFVTYTRCSDGNISANSLQF